MSRLARAIEILEAINKHFQEGADCVYRDGLILDDENTLGNAIADYLSVEVPTVDISSVVIPRSQKRHIWKNVLGNWGGFIGKRKVMDFGMSEEAANQWLWGI